MGAVAAFDRGAAGAGCTPVAGGRHIAEVQAERGRCIRLPPIDAMLRICADADNSSACAMTGN